jgi:acetolactate synthase-1/2/3 large subunit
MDAHRSQPRRNSGVEAGYSVRRHHSGEPERGEENVMAGSTLRETVSDVLLETLQTAGMRLLFANLGTDYPPLLETLAKYGAAGVQLPRMVICPHETTAVTAAHGAFLASVQGQGVLVHVGVGTQNMGGAVHQAFTGRVPMLVFAGRTPATTRGEVPGSRDNFIHYYQDVRDQPGTIRQASKWEFALELPEQIAYAVQRGLRVMRSDPQGAIYLTAGRELLGMPVPAGLRSDPIEGYGPPSPGTLDPPAARNIAERLSRAERPLIVTSYLGRRREAVEVLVTLSEALGIPVVESFATHLNFPRTHTHHWGFLSAPAIGEADFVILVDTDVPWIHKTGGPKPGTPVIQLDVDPVKQHMTIWDFPVTESHRVDAGRALADILAEARRFPAPDAAARKRWIAAHPPEWPGPDCDGSLTVGGVSDLLSRELGPDTVLFDETVSNADTVRAGTRSARPGGYFGTSGGSLGWGGGAAFGHKLMRPEEDVAWLVGDGSFHFGVPSSLYSAAQRYRVPFLTVIYNNGGWRAVKVATDRMYGAGGHAARAGEYHHSLGERQPLHEVAAPFGCFTAEARNADGLVAAVREAKRHLAQGRCAVINALIEQ